MFYKCLPSFCVEWIVAGVRALVRVRRRHLVVFRRSGRAFTSWRGGEWEGASPLSAILYVDWSDEWVDG